MHASIGWLLVAVFNVVLPQSANPSSSAAATDIEFLGKKFILAHSAASDGQSIAEYLPPKQSLEGFHSMVASYFYEGHSQSALHEAKSKIAEVQQRRNSGDSIANGTLFRSEKGESEAIVDFVISEGKTVEHNVMYLKNLEDGLLLAKFVRRFYLGEGKTKAELARFFSTIKADRNRVVKALQSRRWR